MAFLKTANRAESTLDGGINDAALSMDVAVGDGALFPAAGDFHITIEDEILVCTARAGDTLTVTRAAEGTIAAAHADAVKVELRITKGVVDAIEAEIDAKIAKSLLTTLNDVIVRGAADPERLNIAASRVLGRIAAGNLIGMSMAQLWAILSGAPAAAVDMNGQKFTNITGIWDDDQDTGIQVEEGADEDKIRMDVAGIEAFLLSDVGIQTLVKQSGGKMYLSSNQMVGSGAWDKVDYNAESFDIQNEFDTAVNHRYTATEAGTYAVFGSAWIDNLGVGKNGAINLYKNGVSIQLVGLYNNHTGTVDAGRILSNSVQLAANDYLELWVYHNNGANALILCSEPKTYLAVCKMA